jgi:hypothetical protein
MAYRTFIIVGLFALLDPDPATTFKADPSGSEALSATLLFTSSLCS